MERPVACPSENSIDQKKQLIQSLVDAKLLYPCSPGVFSVERPHSGLFFKPTNEDDIEFILEDCNGDTYFRLRVFEFSGLGERHDVFYFIPVKRLKLSGILAGGAL